MVDRTVILTAIESVAAARRTAQADVDAIRAAQLSGGLNDEQPLQTSTAIVRLLDNAIRDLTDAVGAIDQMAQLASDATAAGKSLPVTA